VEYVGYHGTTKEFESFTPRPPEEWSHPTSALGVFLSGDPRVAAVFVMDPDVVEEASNVIAGSRVLLKNGPWGYARMAGKDTPYEEGARILACAATLNNPYRMHAADYAEFAEKIIEEWDSSKGRAEALRDRLIALGHDGIVVPAWRKGDRLLSWGGEPCVEFAADTIVVFDPAAVAITGRMEPDEAYEPAPTPGMRP